MCYYSNVNMIRDCIGGFWHMKIFEGFQKGVDLGGWLSQGSYDREHLDTFIVEDDIRKISGWGLDHVRVPVDYNIFETDEGDLKNDGIELLDRALAWCKKYGLNMIIDVHKVYGYSFYSGDNEHGFFDDDKLQERFYRLWERLAVRYGKYPDHVVFELLNEVTDRSYSKTWNKIAMNCIGMIRKFAPTTKILIGGYWNNSIDALKDLDMPYDANVVYNFHCYDPFLFTHQAAYWVDEMPEDFRIAYPGDIRTYRDKVKELKLDEKENYTDVSDNGFDSSYFDKRFKRAVKLCEDRGCSLYCGEYGVIENADPEQTLSWYKDITSVFRKYGIGHAAWSYKQMNFGLTDEHMSPVFNEIIKYL